MDSLKKFEIPSHVQILENNGMTLVQLTHANGSSAQVYLLGATVTSYRTAKKEEVLFLSSKAIFKEGKAIRGGIPICFPQFGPGALPQHGFARNRLWKIASTGATFNAVQVNLVLQDDEETRKVWNHAFQVEYIVCVHPTRLATEVLVTNKNTSEAFSFTACLHNYFRINDIAQTSISPLNNLKYVDKVQGGKQVTSDVDSVSFNGETDRVYLGAPSTITITDKSQNPALIFQLDKTGFDDCVVWNPGATKSKEIADLGPDEWKNMVCAEAGAIGSPITLQPGHIWRALQHLSKL